MPRKAKYITIIQGHPDPQPSHFGHALAETYVRGAKEAGHDTHVINVAMLDFPLLRSKQELEHGEPPAAIRQAQAELARADHVVMIYPVWNGGLPALLRGFLEQTFRPAFIFPDAKPNEKLGFLSYFNQRKALKGKTAHIIATMQMPAFVYRWYFHPHTEKNTFSLGGIGPIRESLIGLVETPDGRKREEWLRKMYVSGREGR